MAVEHAHCAPPSTSRRARAPRALMSAGSILSDRVRVDGLRDALLSARLTRPVRGASCGFSSPGTWTQSRPEAPRARRTPGCRHLRGFAHLRRHQRSDNHPGRIFLGFSGGAWRAAVPRREAAAEDARAPRRREARVRLRGARASRAACQAPWAAAAAAASAAAAAVAAWGWRRTGFSGEAPAAAGTAAGAAPARTARTAAAGGTAAGEAPARTARTARIAAAAAPVRTRWCVAEPVPVLPRGALARIPRSSAAGTAAEEAAGTAAEAGDAAAGAAPWEL